MEYLKTHELLNILRLARSRSKRDWAMIVIGFRHGMRCSEICGLKMADVDMKNSSITVRRLKGSLQTTQPLCGHRGQPLLDEQMALRAYLRDRGDGDGSNFLFLSQKGGKLDRSAFYRAFRSIAEAAGLEQSKCHPHVLKHSLATALVAQNVNLAMVKTALGHKSISSTMRYVGVSDGQAAAVAQAARMAAF